MSFIKILKKWFSPTSIIHDSYGDYVKRKAEKVDRGWPVDENTPLIIQRLLKEGWVVIEPDKNKLKERGDIIMPGKHTKEKLEKVAPGKEGYDIKPSIMIEPHSKLKYAEVKWGKTEDKFNHAKKPASVPEVDWYDAMIKGKLPDGYPSTLKTIDLEKTDSLVSHDQFSVPGGDIIEFDTWEDIREDQYEMVDLVDKLQTENTDLKHAVEYYEKYVKWLEENYIFILRSPKSLKEDFDKIIGGKDNE